MVISASPRPTDPMAWVGLEVTPHYVTLLDEGGGDQEWLAPLASLLGIRVDWMVEGGQLTLHFVSATHVVTFPLGDSGQACADAISDLTRVWSGKPPIAWVEVQS